MQNKSISIIGLGALGSTLLKGLVHHGLKVRSIYSRHTQKTESMSDEYNISIWGKFPKSNEDLGDIVFLTVSDDAIEPVARRLADLESHFENEIFVHCSGVSSAGLLSPLKERNAGTVSMHPLQTFNEQSDYRSFEDIFFSLQGDEDAFPVMTSISSALGATAIPISEETKPYLHAAAVFASNYLITLLDAAGKLATMGGLDEKQAVEMLIPLVQRTLHNVQLHGTDKALSGPVARGDVGTIQKHFQLIGDDHNLEKLYKVLGLETISIARAKGTLGEKEEIQLKRIFEEEN